MFSGDFSALGTTIYDPNSGAGGAAKTPFPGNIIPANRIDPISQKFLKYYDSVQPAGPVEQLHAVQLFAQQPGWFHSAHGFRGIVEVAVDRPL